MNGYDGSILEASVAMDFGVFGIKFSFLVSVPTVQNLKRTSLLAKRIATSQYLVAANIPYPISQCPAISYA